MGLREKFIVFLLRIMVVLGVSIACMMLTTTLIANIVLSTMRCGDPDYSCFGSGFMLGVVSPIISLGVGFGVAIWLYRKLMGYGKGKRKVEEG